MQYNSLSNSLESSGTPCEKADNSSPTATVYLVKHPLPYRRVILTWNAEENDLKSIPELDSEVTCEC
jgi:hypothetical protein